MDVALKGAILLAWWPEIERDRGSEKALLWWEAENSTEEETCCNVDVSTNVWITQYLEIHRNVESLSASQGRSCTKWWNFFLWQVRFLYLKLINLFILLELQNCVLWYNLEALPNRIDCLDQCFSTFVRPRPNKFFFHKTRARSQQIYSQILSNFFFLSSYIKLT